MRTKKETVPRLSLSLVWIYLIIAWVVFQPASTHF